MLKAADGDDSCPFCSCGTFIELSHDFEKPLLLSQNNAACYTLFNGGVYFTVSHTIESFIIELAKCKVEKHNNQI